MQSRRHTARSGLGRGLRGGGGVCAAVPRAGTLQPLPAAAALRLRAARAHSPRSLPAEGRGAGRACALSRPGAAAVVRGSSSERGGR